MHAVTIAVSGSSPTLTCQVETSAIGKDWYSAQGTPEINRRGHTGGRPRQPDLDWSLHSGGAFAGLRGDVLVWGRPTTPGWFRIVGSASTDCVWTARRSVAGTTWRVRRVARLDLRLRFLDEARLAACVHHANVVGVQQAAADEERPFLVLDYVEGVSLDRLVGRLFSAGQKIPVPIALRIVLDALRGLYAVHEARCGGTGSRKKRSHAAARPTR